MNTNDFAAGVSAAGIARRSDGATFQGRSASLALAAVFLAIAGSVLTAAASPDHEFSMVLRLGLFIAAAAAGVASVSSLRRAAGARPGDGATSEDTATGASAAWRLVDSIWSVQLGPDLEQVIGRQTGART